MKNRFFAVLLLVLAVTVRANDDAAQFAVALARVGVEAYAADQEHQQSLPNEKNFRKRLYWLSEHNPFFYKLDSFQKDFDYYIAILDRHIKTLEDKAALQKNGLTSGAMRKALISSTLSALSGYATCYFLLLRNELKSGIYHDTMRSALQQSKSTDLMLTAVVFGFTSACLAALAGKSFYKASRYTERLVERLERDKNLLAALEQEKVVFDSKKANGAVDAAVNNIVNGIVIALNNAFSAHAATE